MKTREFRNKMNRMSYPTDPVGSRSPGKRAVTLTEGRVPFVGCQQPKEHRDLGRCDATAPWWRTDYMHPTAVKAADDLGCFSLWLFIGRGCLPLGQ